MNVDGSQRDHLQIAHPVRYYFFIFTVYIQQHRVTFKAFKSQDQGPPLEYTFEF